ncbi:MAG TPA: AAA family ATPase [Geobacteraceae bacterium]
MYWEYFGFSEQPFALTPNPHFLFLSSHHQEAFAHLLYAIETRAGFIELTGEVGAGKTTIIRTLLNQLEPETNRTALIFNPTLSPLGFLQEINREFHLPAGSSETRELHEALNSFLLEENRAGRTVVLVIDEAQNLAPAVLEQIRLISNLETEQAKLIQIVLVGQPELKPLLAREDLRQLNQRITVRYHLQAMDFADTREYIRHRLRVAAGGRELLSFSAGAVRRIYRFSGGLPRLINGVCDRALLLAYTRETHTVTTAMANQAIADFGTEARQRPRYRHLALAAVVIALVGAAAGMAVVARTPRPASVATARPVVPPLDRAAVLAELAATPAHDNLLATVNTVLAAWQIPALTADPVAEGDLKALARQRGFTATEVTGTLDTLAHLDAPALLQVELPNGERRYLALTGLDRERGRVAPAVAGREILTRQEMAAIWPGTAVLLWKNVHTIPNRLRPGGKVRGVKPLQELLKSAGIFSGTVNGIFDVPTERALRTFQQAAGLDVDGKPGDRTLLMLYRKAGGFFPPGLSRPVEQVKTEGNG